MVSFCFVNRRLVRNMVTACLPFLMISCNRYDEFASDREWSMYKKTCRSQGSTVDYCSGASKEESLWEQFTRYRREGWLYWRFSMPDDYKPDYHGVIKVGIAYSSVDKIHVTNGAELAIENINQYQNRKTSNKGLLGYYVKPEYQCTEDPETKKNQPECVNGKINSDIFIRDSDLIAVVGHKGSKEAVAASIKYDLTKTIYIAPFVSNKDLTINGLGHVFRTEASSVIIAKHMAEQVKKKKLKNMAVIYDTDSYSVEISEYFQRFLSINGIVVSYAVSYVSGSADFQAILGDLQERRQAQKRNFKLTLDDNDRKKESDDQYAVPPGPPIDSVFFAGVAQDGKLFLEEYQKNGLTSMPIFSVDAMDVPEIENYKMESERWRLFVPTAYNPWNNHPYENFFNDYCKKFNSPPNKDASKVYDSLSLLFFSVKAVRSFEAERVRRFLLLPNTRFRGVNGKYKFMRNGDLERMEVKTKYISNSGCFFVEGGQPCQRQCGE